MNLDIVRMDIFREIMKLDGEKLNEMYTYVHSLTANEQTEESRLLKELLISSAHSALQAHEDGVVYSTKEVMEKLDNKMGWK